MSVSTVSFRAEGLALDRAPLTSANNIQRHPRRTTIQWWDTCEPRDTRGRPTLRRDERQISEEAPLPYPPPEDPQPIISPRENEEIYQRAVRAIDDNVRNSDRNLGRTIVLRRSAFARAAMVAMEAEPALEPEARNAQIAAYTREADRWYALYTRFAGNLTREADRLHVAIAEEELERSRLQAELDVSPEALENEEPGHQMSAEAVQRVRPTYGEDLISGLQRFRTVVDRQIWLHQSTYDNRQREIEYFQGSLDRMQGLRCELLARGVTPTESPLTFVDLVWDNINRLQDLQEDDLLAICGLREQYSNQLGAVNELFTSLCERLQVHRGQEYDSGDDADDEEEPPLPSSDQVPTNIVWGGSSSTSPSRDVRGSRSSTEFRAAVSRHIAGEGTASLATSIHRNFFSFTENSDAINADISPSSTRSSSPSSSSTSSSEDDDIPSDRSRYPPAAPTSSSDDYWQRVAGTPAVTSEGLSRNSSVESFRHLFPNERAVPFCAEEFQRAQRRRAWEGHYASDSSEGAVFDLEEIRSMIARSSGAGGSLESQDEDDNLDIISPETDDTEDESN